MTPDGHDPRNVVDEFKGMSEQDIIAVLDTRGSDLEIAIENTLRDFNMGSIVRSANAFGVRHVHIIGRRGWNKRGAMMTDKYLHVHHHESFAEFGTVMAERSITVVAVDNVPGAVPIHEFRDRPKAVLLFGQEGPGLSDEALTAAAHVVAIGQFGSTRSLNVGVAAGIVLYAWRHGV